jgi:hypothetical protein
VIGYGALAKFIAVGLVLAGAAAGGWHLGAGRVQGQWDAAELERERQVRDDRAAQQRLANEAAQRFELERQALAAGMARARRAVADALAAPAVCPPSGRLADVVVPAAALDGLRAASVGAGATRPAASGADGPVLARPGDP